MLPSPWRHPLGKGGAGRQVERAGRWLSPLWEPGWVPRRRNRVTWALRVLGMSLRCVDSACGAGWVLGRGLGWGCGCWVFCLKRVLVQWAEAWQTPWLCTLSECWP